MASMLLCMRAMLRFYYFICLSKVHATDMEHVPYSGPLPMNLVQCTVGPLNILIQIDITKVNALFGLIISTQYPYSRRNQQSSV